VCQALGSLLGKFELRLEIKLRLLSFVHLNACNTCVCMHLLVTLVHTVMIFVRLLVKLFNVSVLAQFTAYCTCCFCIADI
jgi:hypothetical protein